jgi:hypothetical protein
MKLLNIFKQEAKPSATPEYLPAGSFTVSRAGQITACTLPSSVPRPFLKQLAGEVVSTMREAQKARMPLAEFTVDFPEFKLAAREMSGGAIIFFIPR